MEPSSGCSRRVSRGVDPRPDQEAWEQGSKMSCRVEQEDGNQNPCWKENKEPREALQNARKKKNRHTDCRFLRNRTRTGYTGFMFGHEVPPCRPEIRTALIRTTRIQNPMHTLNQNSAVAVIPRNQADPTSTETHVDQNKEAQTSSKLLDTGTTWSSDQGAAVQQVTRSRSKTKTETRPKSRRRKVQQFVFSSRGQLRLSITPEAGQLTIYIHEARGLMGKSCRSCDSYVKLGVTSDLCRSIRMKTGTVQNNKNPTYQQNFSLSVSEPLLQGRLVISVHRCLPDSRCSQLIGCMSFGIGSLIRSSQLITGWFYLLREEIGQSKHMRVTSQRNRPKKSHLVKLEQQGLEPRGKSMLRLLCGWLFLMM
ncbi:PREDICTED: uncharacterized protein LOC107101378 isoform X2 [Cyprinodon variegatus]|uniref:uncharacterized protein LOC107101378 isoform X2 n=1 Tax=Cyprinodon variegatus TaxID=28743 RepID=UPI0007429D73|nr:PREDICTED: uncharacterized protein LOC107101378 isoform X2 [Cyprinodon variegatus]